MKRSLLKISVHFLLAAAILAAGGMNAAQAADAPDAFYSSLKETKTFSYHGRSMPLLRDERDSVQIILKFAESLYRSGDSNGAWLHLNYARNKLGFAEQPTMVIAPLRAQ